MLPTAVLWVIGIPRMGTGAPRVCLEILSSSRSAELDRWVQRTLQNSEFQPGLLDGVPAPTTVEETVQVEYRR